MPLNFNQFQRALPGALFSSFLAIITIILSCGYIWSVQSNIIPSANHELIYFIGFSIILIIFNSKLKVDFSFFLYISSIIIQLISSNDTESNLVYFCYSSLIFLSYQLGFCINNKKNTFLITKIIISSTFTAGLISTFIIFYQKLNPMELNDIYIWILPLNSERAYANLAQPNHASTLLCSATFISLFSLKKNTNIITITSCILITILTAAVFLTSSRTGFITLASAPLLALILRTDKKTLINSTIPPIILTLLLLTTSITESTTHGIQSKGITSGRYLLWDISASIIKEHPLMGHGYRNTLEIFLNSLINNSPHDFQELSFPSSSHNFIMDIAIYFGIPFALLFLIFFSTKLYSSVKNGLSAHRRVAFAAATPIGIHALLEFPLNYTYFSLPFFFLIGLSLNTQHNKIYLSFPRAFTQALTFAVLIISLEIITNYYSIALDFNKLKLELAGIELKTPYKWREGCILQHYCDFLNVHTIENGSTEKYSSLIDKVAHRSPTQRTLQLKLYNSINYEKDLSTAEKWNTLYNLIYSQKIEKTNN